MTNQFAQLLLQSANEVREYQRTSPNAHTFGTDWLEHLATRLEQASLLSDFASITREINSISYLIVDSGPLTEDFSPSFQQVLGDVQSHQKKLEQEKKKR